MEYNSQQLWILRKSFDPRNFCVYYAKVFREN